MDPVESSEDEGRGSEALAVDVADLKGINVEPMLEQKLKDIVYKVPEGAKRVPWVDTMSIDGKQSIPEEVGAKDGVRLEGEFLKMAGDAVKEAYRRLRVMKIPCSRPDDFYAEMLRTDSLMYKVRARASEELRRIKVVEDRKKAETAKKFAKRARSKKLEARAMERRQSLAEIKDWQDKSKQDKKNADNQDLETIINKQKRKGDARDGSQGKKGEVKRNPNVRWRTKSLALGARRSGHAKTMQTLRTTSTNLLGPETRARARVARARERVKEKGREGSQGRLQ